jgi:hypothetical protein
MNVKNERLECFGQKNLEIKVIKKGKKGADKYLKGVLERPLLTGSTVSHSFPVSRRGRRAPTTQCFKPHRADKYLKLNILE